ncbi:MOSC domain-containing protein [Lipingzhangella sp. LS1_29]|uniref:MOSC domain-containing protein n=1 Tax=Lipingzhangella rawalii TaxID=2055835 RepID=A0ABU2H355_9ACTN|nr:MOSC domain-containing protein [Lipingzhangella rawalii]MDS1269280.1 MOSC domain-containing protein [Lipingzhangella rawalii]
MTATTRAMVNAVSRSPGHHFHKDPTEQIELVAGWGIAGDGHAGATVQHRSRVARDPSQPNLRQVHLMHSELHTELCARGFTVGPGDLGENITTAGVDLLGLGTGTRLQLGTEAIVEVTGLRNPCRQIEEFQEGLLAAVLERDPSGAVVRRAGVMGVVVQGGTVWAGDAIRLQRPAGPHRPLEPV